MQQIAFDNFVPAETSPIPSGEIRRPFRLVWATDIHLNFLSDPAAEAFAGEITQKRPDAVAITGDIAEAPNIDAYLLMLSRLIRVPIYFVLGNHDFYRGEIRSVRARMTELSRAHPSLQWMPVRGVVPVTRDHALVGHDGWGDGRIGDFSGSDIQLSDWTFIRELAGHGRRARLERLRSLGDEAAEWLRTPLDDALSLFRSVIVLTHVPPFRESCWYDGRISSDDWLPWFTCQAVGDVLLEAAKRSPEKRITVLCGHTHGGGIAQILPNLVVHTGSADYGRPVISGVWDLEPGADI